MRQRIMGVSVSLDENAETIPMEGQLVEDMMVSMEECRMVREAVRKAARQIPDSDSLILHGRTATGGHRGDARDFRGRGKPTRVHRAKKILREKLEGLL